jgi:peptidoglycan/LPS O-acetylase OafA/YrhL
MRYRAEVDGLRALAVIPVMLFHAGAPFIPGGYIGVDIFFVISGFLITLTILADENFSPTDRIARFYDRRIRRIIPALALVVSLALAAGVKLLLPAELMQLGKSAAATALFVSNFWFWSQSGYFQEPAESMPLLHTWSLAVEEQFYIGFPLLMIIIGKGRCAASLLVISLLVIALFALSVYLTKHSPGVAFYWPTRAWELLVGAALALTEDGPRLMRETISMTGLVSIIVSLFVFDRTTPFPGYAALAPVLGTAAVIYGGGATLVGRILSLRPFVWVGLVSYSLYLWHWPILVYAKQALVTEHLSLVQATGCIVATFFAAALSWRLVEKPFRKLPAPRMRLFFGTAALIGCVVAAGVALFALMGLPNRFPPESLILAQAQTAKRPDNCVQVGSYACQVGAGKARFILWGDSHAGALSPAISNIASTPGLYAIFDSCPPLPSFVPSGLPGDDLTNCKAHNKEVLKKARADQNIDVIILASFWSSYKFSEGDLRYVLDALSEKHVIIVGDNPTPRFNVPRTLALNGHFEPIHPSTSAGLFHIIYGYPNVKLIELSDALCSEGACPPEQGLRALYSDENHISAYAANTIVTAFLKDRLSGIMPATSPATR